MLVKRIRQPFSNCVLTASIMSEYKATTLAYGFLLNGVGKSLFMIFLQIQSAMKQFLLLVQLLLQCVKPGIPSAVYPAEANGLVDLGYAKHIPTYINTTASGQRVAIYKNIRFANSPTGNLRFRKPDTNLRKQHGIQDGKASIENSTCISTAPWMVPFPGINGTTFGVEDCLFLDVFVPEGVKAGDGVPVLQFFVGSAYAFGGKEYFFTPMGLFDRMKTAGHGKFIFVVNNYRQACPQRE